MSKSTIIYATKDTFVSTDTKDSETLILVNTRNYL